MTTAFESIKQGLREALNYSKGEFNEAVVSEHMVEGETPDESKPADTDMN
ncbi:hypothetical protein [Catenovulum agarivorans]|nr:hypothetical protein [Catenovulum agarivorans]